ncbi:SAM-dependent methyltransferase [Schaalia odontolytica]|uniref:HsdM family class I SAM-dependent methyltransferase n=1 Tax=Schaalia odontolytica TaxID=1660 RepID=UPI00210D0AD2|nr:SAM-dependent methyltransferase [Schaalia odontolytica]
MERIEIIDAVGREYVTSNIEKGEFSYPKAFKEKNFEFEPIKKQNAKGSWQFLDIRFELDGVSLLIETKNDADKWPTVEEQIAAYVEYEKRLTGNKIIAVVANTTNDYITVWKSEVEDDCKLVSEQAIRTMPEYVAMFDAKHTNNKEEVMRNTYRLNELLHRYGVGEKLRSQFVGTCLLAIKNGLNYNRQMKTAQIVSGIRTILEDLLENSLKKAEKLTLIDWRVLRDQDVRDMDSENLCIILDFIRTRIFPFINDKSTAGQDLLNLFFITFNKYVGKSDKNQAFTPDHITDFMAKICNVNKKSVVLDMTCGSGSFLVRAMTQALADCHTQAEEDDVKKRHIYGVEYDELVYGLATTNMLIHGDGNSNIIQGSCFDEVPRFIADGVRFNVVLMNPPYNAMAKQVPNDYAKTWGKSKQDPTKGLYFVKFILDQMNEHDMQGKLAVLLPMACAIGSSKLMKQVKNEILKSNTLDAVFSLPDDIFYPGASVCACCMVFDVGMPHRSANRETFFAYCKDDCFKKRKNLGRVEQMDENGNGLWSPIQEKWLGTYKNRDIIPGFSARQMVDGDDEWLCEAYMETDYTTLTCDDFQQTVNDYLAYLVKTGVVYEG